MVCRGVLQGLGVRPALQRLATCLGLHGTLENDPGGLVIDLWGLQSALAAFLEALPAALPAGALLEGMEPRWLDPPDPPWGKGVRIGAAAGYALGQSLFAPGLSPDRAPCPQCLAELRDPSSRRHRYPFISCCACGPRFSLTTALPFCRAHTTLAALPPCPACAEEFNDSQDRRFHAETISCPACGPRLMLGDSLGMELAGAEDALRSACQLLQAGGILALQGVGGFQLLVDATQPEAVRRLRRRKQRPAKPFALLLADLRWLEGEVTISAAEETWLHHPAAPIVLLSRLSPAAPGCWDVVAPGSPSLGIMLPASPLHHLLVEHMVRPLVATSGNRSGEPLCLSPAEARQRLAGIADAFLMHDLAIARPLDDSLLQLIDGRPALLRRARGFVPEPLPWQGPAGSAGPASLPPVLALGGDLKAAPALVLDDRVWLSPHLGDLVDGEVQRRWQGALEDQRQLPLPPPSLLACDAHPGYGSHQFARRWAHREHLPLEVVPHHLAHGLAVLAERREVPPLLVVAWDGLGLADQATGEPMERLWGGELLLIEAPGEKGVGWQRLAALRPFPLPGGERASREPRRCALGLLAAAGDRALGHPGASTVLRAFSPQERDLLLGAITAGLHAPLTSSLGRFVDGVASLLGLVQHLTYEGEGGLRWQGAAARWQGGTSLRPPSTDSWRIPLGPAQPADSSPPPLGRWDWEPLVRALLDHGATGGSAEQAAWRVQQALVAAIVKGAEAASAWSGCRRVALAGGCFQNRGLLEGALQGLRARGLEPLWSQQVPCNDGGLALGQAWAAQAGGSAYNQFRALP